jgi:hypothetical protein
MLLDSLADKVENAQGSTASLNRRLKETVDKVGIKLPSPSSPLLTIHYSLFTPLLLTIVLLLIG